MKKFFYAFVIITLAFIFIGCDKKQTFGEVTIIVVDYEGNEVFSEKISFNKNDSLLDLMKDHEGIALKGKETANGYFATEVFGISAKDYNWVYWKVEVNEEDAYVDIKTIKLNNQDVFTFSLIDKTISEISIIIVDYEGDEVFNDKIIFGEDDDLIELLENHEEIALKGEESSFGFYIVEILGISANDYNQVYWSIEVNNEYSLVGIGDIKLVDQDIIKLSLIGY